MQLRAKPLRAKPLRAKPLSMAEKCETTHLQIFEPPSGDKHGRFEDRMFPKLKFKV